MLKFLKENWIVITVGAALLIGMVLAIQNNTIIERNNNLQKQSELVKQRVQDILTETMHGFDLGVRGYGLTKDDKLLAPYNQAVIKTPTIFHQLDSLLKEQHYEGLAGLQIVKQEVDEYISFSKQMLAKAKADDMEAFVSMLKEDKGHDVWQKYTEFTVPLFAYEDKLKEEALANYNAAVRNNLVLQILIIMLALPALFIFVYRVRKEHESRQALLKEVEDNDRKYVFDSGMRLTLTAQEINESTIRNVRMASGFIDAMADGKYDVEWVGLTQTNRDLNKETLAGNLLNLQEKLKRVKEEDERRNSVNENLARFSEIVRNHQHDSNQLADQCVSFLVNTLHAQQASLFIVTGNDDDRYLQLASCYAFDKKKWTEKRIEIGNGLVGQAFLEGDVIQLTQIPQGYTSITSGLGQATPEHLVIVPMKYDVRTVAIIEVASLTLIEPHQIEFLRRAGEFMASAILNSQTTLTMKTLLDNAVKNEVRMREREEEMKQNVEELQATQEELVRKDKEMQMRMPGTLQQV